MKIVPASERGDTIIEVLLAIGVLAMLVTITYTAMLRAIAVAYNSLDRTNTQAMINGQANLIRAAHNRYLTASTESEKQPWRDIVQLAVSGTNAPATRDDGCTVGVDQDTQAFYLNPAGVGLLQLEPVKGVSVIKNPRDLSISTQPKLGNGMWVEAYQMTPTSINDGSVDPHVYTFYIKACTPPIYGDGSAINRQTKTVMRLYAE